MKILKPLHSGALPGTQGGAESAAVTIDLPYRNNLIVINGMAHVPINHPQQLKVHVFIDGEKIATLVGWATRHQDHYVLQQRIVEFDKRGTFTMSFECEPQGTPGHDTTLDQNDHWEIYTIST